MAKSNASENRDFVARVETVQVKAWIGFRVSCFLCLSQCLGKFDSVLLHLREYVVAGTVHDAIDGLNRVRSQGFGNSTDHGDAAGNAGFNTKGQILLLR